MKLIGRNGKLMLFVHIWGGGKRIMSNDESQPPSSTQESGGVLGSIWPVSQGKTELKLSIDGLSHSDPEVRRACAERLSTVFSQEALLALRAANAVENIVSCKAEIVRAIRAMEEHLEPQAQPA